MCGADDTVCVLSAKRDAVVTGLPIVAEKDCNGESEAEEYAQVDPQCVSTEEIAQEVFEAHKSVQSWDDSRFDKLCTLQAASRNNGHVALMRSLEKGGHVAVKCMPNEWVCNGHSDFMRRFPLASEKPWYDIGITRYLHKVKYPYICEPIAVYRDPEVTYVVSSLAAKGDLFKWCERGPAPGIAREIAIRPVMVQVFEAVRLLHDLGIAHGDISMENIVLVDGDGQEPRVRLIDFGMASWNRRCSMMRGKPSYMTPEMHWEVEYDPFPADVFALGVVLFALANREYPWNYTSSQACHFFEYFQERGLMEFLQWRRRLQRPRLWIEKMSPELLHLLEGLLACNPEDRWTLGEVCWKCNDASSDAPVRRPSVWECRWVQRGLSSTGRCPRQPPGVDSGRVGAAVGGA